MKINKDLLAVLLVFVVALVWNGLFHGLVIAGPNATIAPLRRSDLAAGPWLAVGMTLSIAALFVLSYGRWRRTGTMRESLVHGLFFALLAGLLVDANQYLGYPIPGALAVLWFLGGVVEFALDALVVCLVYRHGSALARGACCDG
jgi:hypothetical protein